jgi:adenylate kinase
MPLNVVMIGPPGAGKGTQSERLCRLYRIPWISTGDILREAVHVDSPLGRAVRETIVAGRLVADDLMIDVVTERLGRADAEPGFILDGFPRTVVQARALDVMMTGRGPIVPIVIVVPEHELVRRLTLRRICSECGATFGLPGAGLDAPVDDHCPRCGGTLVQRKDDNADVVRQRQRLFAEITRPLVEYYRGYPTFASIDGLQPPDDVTSDLRAHMDMVIAAVARDAGRARA